MLAKLLVTARTKENKLRAMLVDKVAKSMIELGVGFPYVGKGVVIDVGGDEFEIDLLFYHVVLHRYIVIELKTGKSHRKDLGQLGFYMTEEDTSFQTRRKPQGAGEATPQRATGQPRERGAASPFGGLKIENLRRHIVPILLSYPPIRPGIAS